MDIKKVTDEFQMLQAFCGKDEKFSLVSIEWDSGESLFVNLRLYFL